MTKLVQKINPMTTQNLAKALSTTDLHEQPTENNPIDFKSRRDNRTTRSHQRSAQSKRNACRRWSRQYGTSFWISAPHRTECKGRDLHITVNLQRAFAPPSALRRFLWALSQTAIPLQYPHFKWRILSVISLDDIRDFVRIDGAVTDVRLRQLVLWRNQVLQWC